jgi:SAM-dependent methyltransferase
MRLRQGRSDTIRPLLAYDRSDPPAARIALHAAHCACPTCHLELSWTADAAYCSNCRRGFAIVDGIPVFAPLDRHRAAAQHNQQQAAFFDAQPEDWETTRPLGAPALYGWLMSEKFRRSILGIESMLPGAVVLTVCGGSGMDAEFLARAGARVIASDISLGAAKRIQTRADRHGVAITPIVAEAESLPFRSGAVDIVYVHDGLHHLDDPMAGLREMARVARSAVSLTEPTRALATAVAVRLGISENEEQAGNRVQRLQPKAVVHELEDSGFRVLGIDRYAMYYRHEPGAMVRMLSRGPLFHAAKTSFLLANGPLARIGNKMSVRAVSRNGVVRRYSSLA